MGYGYREPRFRLGMGGGFPPAVKYLILANIGVFVLQNIFPGTLEPLFGLVPYSLLHRFAVWQLFSYMFLHGGLMHIFINMLVLWMFGAEIERTWGSREFLKYYVITGVGAGLIQVIVNALLFPGNQMVPVVGASGAIYGLLLAFALLFPDREIFLLLAFILPVRIQAKYLAMIFAGLALFSGLFGGNSGVAHFAHLGGMLVGLVYLKVDWWRLGGIASWVRQKRASRQIVKQARRRQQEMRLREHVDAILDKINEVGYENLTEEEKEILRKASRFLSKEEP